MKKQNPFLNQEIASSYDNYYKKRVGKFIDLIEKDAINELLLNEKKKLIEFGCGTGHWSVFFSEKGFEVTGIDSSEEMLRMANKKAITNDKLKFIHVSAENSKIENKFDVAAFITSLEFMDDPEKVIKSAISCLKDEKGVLIFGVLNADSNLAKFSGDDPIFSNATFYTVQTLKALIQNISPNAIITSNQCVFVSPTEMENLSDEEIFKRERELSEDNKAIGTFIAMRAQI